MSEIKTAEHFTHEQLKMWRRVLAIHIYNLLPNAPKAMRQGAASIAYFIPDDQVEAEVKGLIEIINEESKKEQEKNNAIEERKRKEARRAELRMVKIK